MKWSIIHLLPLMALALASHQYHYVPDRKTWSEAQTHCREKYTDLATIRDSSDMQRLNELSSHHNINGSVWIGLYNKLQNWSNELDKVTGERSRCFYYWVQGGWGSCPCSNTYPFICQHERHSTPYGLILIQDGTKTWPEVQRYCQQHYSRLATTGSPGQLAYIKSMTSVSDLLLNPYGNNWTWSDGSEPSFINWLDSKLKYLNSSKRCAASLQTPGSQGGWETQSCTETLPFFCYSSGITNTTSPRTTTPELPTHTSQVPVRKRQVVRVELHVNSSLDLSRTGVQEDILREIRVKLQEKGLPADTKLSWMKQADGQIFHRKNSEEKTEKKSKDEF